MSISRNPKFGVNYYQKKRIFLDLLFKKHPFGNLLTLYPKNIVVIFAEICDNNMSIYFKVCLRV